MKASQLMSPIKASAQTTVILPISISLQYMITQHWLFAVSISAGAVLLGLEQHYHRARIHGFIPLQNPVKTPFSINPSQWFMDNLRWFLGQDLSKFPDVKYTRLEPIQHDPVLSSKVQVLETELIQLKNTVAPLIKQSQPTEAEIKLIVEESIDKTLKNPEFISNILKLIVDPEELEIAKELISKGLGTHIQMNEKLASKVVGIKVSTLRRDRSKGKGIPYYKHDAEVGLISSKSGKFKKTKKKSKATVSYRLGDLLEYVAKRRIDPK